MNNLPPHYQLVETDDGSLTLFSEQFNEACHSTSGAIAETRLHYIEGCELQVLLESHEELNILEVGYGTGLGWQETQKFFLQYPTKKLNFYSLEIDENLIAWSMPKALKTTLGGLLWFEGHQENSTLKVLIGDARKSVRAHPLPKFHAIYQDAFSPKRNPTLWTHQWFSDLKTLSHPDCRLSTYSASVSIRKSLMKAGWSVWEGPAFAQKRSSTRAHLRGGIDEEFLNKLNTHAILALDDKDFL